ncbi:MAG TPA: rhomboid family intramembrane serine protease [Chitinophagales bacterium]|nr:rhomboid family intramembrane serine protease [Chitinophagales bacterium]
MNEQRDAQRNRQRVSVLIPLLFVVILWLIQLLQWGTNSDFGVLGIFPRSFSGLTGILFSPLIHGGWDHLVSNTIPLLVLGFLMIYFYRNVAYRVVLLIWLMDGIGVWLIGRDAYHIGASGIVYGMASFLFFSGILRKSRELLALSLAVVFIYGSMIWGMFPYVLKVSWEAHLVGFLSGIFFAVYYRQKGPPDDVLPEWMNEAEGESEGENGSGNENSSNEQVKKININYIFTPKNPSDGSKAPDK